MLSGTFQKASIGAIKMGVGSNLSTGFDAEFQLCTLCWKWWDSSDAECRQRMKLQQTLSFHYLHRLMWRPDRCQVRPVRLLLTASGKLQCLQCTCWWEDLPKEKIMHYSVWDTWGWFHEREDVPVWPKDSDLAKTLGNTSHAQLCYREAKD